MSSGRRKAAKTRRQLENEFWKPGAYPVATAEARAGGLRAPPPRETGKAKLADRFDPAGQLSCAAQVLEQDHLRLDQDVQNCLATAQAASVP